MHEYSGQGCIKFLIPPVGEEYYVVKRGRIYYGYGEEYNMEKKGKGKQYHLLYNIQAVGKNIKWGRLEDRGILEKKIKI